MTTVWVDADACPRLVREVLFKAADRRGVDVVMVANSHVAIPRAPRVRSVTVPHGFDAADDYIAENATTEDLVVTQDIPLAATLVEKGVAVIDLRGREHDASNIGERLGIRNFMDEMRGTGAVTGGPPAFGSKEKQAFANTFDRVLTRVLASAGR